MVAYTRQKESEIADGLVIEAADLNGDWISNVLDIVGLVNVILAT